MYMQYCVGFPFLFFPFLSLKINCFEYVFIPHETSTLLLQNALPKEIITILKNPCTRASGKEERRIVSEYFKSGLSFGSPSSDTQFVRDLFFTRAAEITENWEP